MSIVTKEAFLTEFFNQLNSNGIHYFVYGEYRSLPQSTGNSDLDIVVYKNDFDRMNSIVLELIRQFDVRLVSRYSNMNMLFYRFLYVNEFHYWGVQLDIIQDGLRHIGTEYFPIKRMLPFVISYKGMVVLDMKKSFYINFIKELLHNKKSKQKYTDVFFDQSKNNREDVLVELNSLYGAGFVNEVLSKEDTPLNKSDFLDLYKSLFASVHKSDLLRRIKVRINSLRRFLQKAPGYDIVVLGTDGSGKSTIINSITPILNETFHNFIVYEHLRPNVIPDLGVLFGKKEKSDIPVITIAPHGQKVSGIFGSLFRWGYYFIDYTFGYLIKIFPIIHTKSKVFIFDRYYYDYYLDQKRLRVNLPKWIVRLGDYFVPTPDLILCLGGDPQKIFERKPETNIKEVSRQVNDLKGFCDKHKKAVWIDTCTSKEESVRQTMAAICEMMSKRFGNQLDR